MSKVGDLTDMDDATIVRGALSDKKVLVKARYIDELARRAIERPELLASACAAIANERMMEPRMGPALGWLGATRILESRDTAATAGLLQTMNEWSPDEQVDLIRVWAGNARVGEVVKELFDLYGWSPKF